MAKTITYATAIDNAINGNLDAETIERLEALKAQLAKRNSSGALKKPTKTQRENEGLKEKICEALEGIEEGLTATEVGDAVGIKCQKAAALLKQLFEAERVNRVQKGKVARYVLA